MLIEHFYIILVHLASNRRSHDKRLEAHCNGGNPGVEINTDLTTDD